MSKVFNLVSLPILAMTALILFIKPVFADQDTCPLRSDPTEINNYTQKAKLYISVGDTNSFDKYQVEIGCQNIIGMQEFFFGWKDAKIEDPNTISVEIDESNPLTRNCLTYIGNHKIIVRRIIKNQNQEQCQAYYSVTDADKNCVLEISPSTNISTATVTPKTPMTLSGKNLQPKGATEEGFEVFFDNQAVDILNDWRSALRLNAPWQGIKTSTFGPKDIPDQFIIPGTHVISLRKRDWNKGVADPTHPQSVPNQLAVPDYFFEPPVCSIGFTVGTINNPGSVNTGEKITDLCTLARMLEGKCSFSAGKQIPGCGDKDDKRGPGIATAIGCIHTNPAELVKDLLTFIIGISGGLAFLMMLLGAFQMLISAGNPETLNAGRERLTSAVIGLLLVIFAILLLQIIGVGILAIPGFGP